MKENQIKKINETKLNRRKLNRIINNFIQEN